MAPGGATTSSAWPQGGGGQKDAAVPGAGQSSHSAMQVRVWYVNSVVMVLLVVLQVKV